MSVSSRYILRQGPVLGALGRIAVLSLAQRFVPARTGSPAMTLPGSEIKRTVPPLPEALIAAYVANVGGDPGAYRGVVPPHLFPQWAFPLAARTLEGLPYPLLRVVNGGCSLTMRRPLPAGEPLEVSARLEHIDDNGRRAVLRQHVVTGTRSAPEALVTDFYAVVPLAGGAKGRDQDGEKASEKGKKSEEKAVVPNAARLVEPWHIGRG